MYTVRAVANESMTVSASAPPRVVLVMGPSCLSHCAAAPTLLCASASRNNTMHRSTKLIAINPLTA